MQELKIYEITLQEDEEIKLSLVDEPAIEIDFLKFNVDKIKMSFNQDKMIVTGPALIPGKKIYRNDKFGERYVFMSDSTVQKFAELLINKKDNKFNLNHSNRNIEASIIESYFTKEINDFNVPKGSWIISLKINKQDDWDMIKNGELNGFSVEGHFLNQLQFNNNKEEMDFKEKLQTVIDAVFFASEKAEVKPEVVEEVVPEVTVEVTEEVPLAFNKEEVEELILSAVTSITEKFNSQLEALSSQLTESNAKLEEFSKQPLSTPVQEVVEQTIVTGDNPALRFFTK